MERIKIKQLWSDGHGVMDIARSLGCGKSKISRWIKRFKAAKKRNIPDEEAILSQPRSGAPIKITSPVKRTMVKYTEDKKKRSTAKIVKHVKRKHGLAVSAESVRKVLKGAGP